MDYLGLASTGLGLGNTVYNLYTNKRDFDYQKALQQEIFDREDTAVQRRMRDLQAAGLNPNLAAGSAASAGSVVSRSNTNDVNMGAALDYLSARQQINLQKQETELKKKENYLANMQNAKYQQDWSYQRAQDLYYLGFNPRISFGDDGKIHVEGAKRRVNFSDTPMGQLMDYQMQSNKNSADLLQKENNWYTANSVINALTSGIGAVSGAVNAGSNAARAYNAIKRFR